MTVTPTAVVLPSEQRPPTLAQQVSKMEHQFALAAPRGVEARQIVRDALTALRQNPDLAKCDPQSVLGGLMTMAQLGLRVGVLGHGWLLPFKANAKGADGQWHTHKAQLVIGYQGLVELAYRSGRIAKVTARTVHANDHFDVEYGLNEHLTHRPAAGDRGEPVAYYATVRLKDSTDPMFYVLTRAEAETYRDRYAMAKKDGAIVGPWATEFDAMARKTCLRQLAKYMPKGTDLAVALAVDDTVRVDITPDAQPEYVSEHVEATTVSETPRVAGEVSAPPTDTAGGQS